jgi:ribosome-binding protein aMBF1 (putative translation factor)
LLDKTNTTTCYLKQKSPQATVILRDALKLAREEKGMSQEELANAARLKRWHIRELEDAETFFNCFYSMEIKLQSAIKVGAYLGLAKEQFLGVSG